jgi:hypothetical protein
MPNLIQRPHLPTGHRATRHAADSVAGPPVLVVPRRSRTPRAIGRFSTGMELLSRRPSVQRTGRFSTGLEHRPEAAPNLLLGRFSTGVEKIAEAPDKCRVGSFATGCDPLD